MVPSGKGIKKDILARAPGSIRRFVRASVLPKFYTRNQLQFIVEISYNLY